jgi:hypothetical protein
MLALADQRHLTLCRYTVFTVYMHTMYTALLHACSHGGYCLPGSDPEDRKILLELVEHLLTLLARTRSVTLTVNSYIYDTTLLP